MRLCLPGFVESHLTYSTLSSVSNSSSPVRNSLNLAKCVTRNVLTESTRFISGSGFLASLAQHQTRFSQYVAIVL